MSENVQKISNIYNWIIESFDEEFEEWSYDKIPYNKLEHYNRGISIEFLTHTISFKFKCVKTGEVLKTISIEDTEKSFNHFKTIYLEYKKRYELKKLNIICKELGVYNNE